MTTTSTKTFSWAMAHLLSEHLGLCKNLHGHNYKMEVTAVSQKPGNVLMSAGPSEGMVVDFKDLKEVVNQIIVEPLDHATMIWSGTSDPFEMHLADLLARYDKKMVKVDYRPTAENMANDFIQKLNMYLNEYSATYRISKIRLWETDSSFSEIE